jgi:acyl-CoA thioester hydrolase
MTTLHLHSLPVREEWLDQYGHLRWSDYLSAFDKAGWAFYEHFGCGEDYVRRTGCGFYTVESHVRYLREVRCDAQLEFEGLVFGADTKRCWFAGVLKVDGIERATVELVDLHVDTRGGRSVPMPEATLAALLAAKEPQIPAWAGRSCSLAKR